MKPSTILSVFTVVATVSAVPTMELEPRAAPTCPAGSFKQICLPAGLFNIINTLLGNILGTVQILGTPCGGTMKCCSTTSGIGSKIKVSGLKCVAPTTPTTPTIPPVVSALPPVIPPVVSAIPPVVSAIPPVVSVSNVVSVVAPVVSNVASVVAPVVSNVVSVVAPVVSNVVSVVVPVATPILEPVLSVVVPAATPILQPVLSVVLPVATPIITPIIPGIGL
ncbi:hypothetical protein J4E91_000181 [Alternaria rosae]|nr:hypothetical protein J4E91_000181 [Alternaria rosae]